MSHAPRDSQRVLDALAETAARLCDARDARIFRVDGDRLRLVARHGSRRTPRAPGEAPPLSRSTIHGRAVLDRRTVQAGAAIATPMLSNGALAGVIAIRRAKATALSAKQVNLLESFAAQAAIVLQELDARARELLESREQQTATAEILRVISSSPGDLQPVFDTIARNAVRLCEAAFAYVFRFDGTLMHVAAHHNLTGDALAALERQWPMRPDRRSVPARAILDRRVIHVTDVLDEPDHPYLATSRALGIRTMLTTPMLRDGQPIGAVAVYRQEVEPFTEQQIALVATFASQAVIAVENVRLFQEREAKNRELAEALEQQTATAEILRAIAGSPTDIQPVLETVVRAAGRFCGATDVLLLRLDGTTLRGAAGMGQFHDVLVRQLGSLAALEIPVTHGTVTGRAVLERRTVHVQDLAVVPEGEFPEGRELQQRFGHHTTAATPLLREGTPVGVIALFRMVVDPFSDRQLELLRVFADQAVIAIENVRLFTELADKNRALTEAHAQVTAALEQQTATSEILRVISSSPTNVQPVFDTIAASAFGLCSAKWGAVTRFDGEMMHLVSLHNVSDPDGSEALRRAFPRPPSRRGATDRAVLTRAVTYIPDVREDPEYQLQDLAQAAGYRSQLSVPMLHEGQPVGAITVAGASPGAFSEQQISLLQTFADQAVIAIENVRLFKELEARNRDLTETLEQQTATGEILRVISSSPTDGQPVFDTIARSAVRLCDAQFCAVFRFDGQLLHFVAHHGMTPEGIEATRHAFPAAADRGSAAGRSVIGVAVEHIPDVQADPEYTFGGLAHIAAYRSIVAVPMVRDGVPIGSITVRRAQAGGFPDQQIDLLKTFADQAVIAIENVRLFKELEAKNRDLTETLEQQTATGEILRVISSSPTDVQPVFDTIARSAARLCEARDAVVYLVDANVLNPVARHGPVTAGPIPLVPGTLGGRTVIERRTMHVADLQAEVEEFPVGAAISQREGTRSMVSVPLLLEDRTIGTIGLRRFEVRPFSDAHIALLQTFAAQAVIAIENVRLFQELEARTRDLTRSVGELRALGEVSQAVGSSLDLETVLETIVSRAVQLSGSQSGIVYEFDEATGTFQARATHRISLEHLEAVRAAPIRLGEGAIGRAGVAREPVQIADIEGEWDLVAPQVRTLLIRDGTHSLLAVPLVREERLLGGLVILRRERGAFSPEVVATMQTFAAQSVLAIHNAGLFREIQRQKQYADALVQTSPVAIVTMDLGGAVVGWNPGAERLFGYTPAEALGQRMEDLVATPEVREEIRANIRQTLGGEWIRTIGRRARKDRTLVDVEISSMPVVVEGAKVGMLGIYHDITELLRARREAEAANEAKSAFLATMSHEIRTPMNAVIGMSGLLLNTPLTDEQREYAEVVRQSGDTLLTVINDVLDYSKIEAGRLELESQPFDLRECVEGALDLVATRAAEKGLDLAYLLGDGAPAAIVGDVTRLRQVLLNLLSNAVKFTEQGEVVLAVGARRLDGPAPDHELTFSVRDTGIGIPPDRLDRLFQSFSQVDASTTRRYGGTGLGLAISQRLTELMGGRIGVTSEVGVGSEFRFTIRAAAAEAPASARRDLSGVQPSLRGKRVLVVDDNATNRRVLTAHLDAWGMPAAATGSPVEALGWIQAGEGFDVGILDMHMPEMDGVALARAIREQPAGTALPLILFTSLGRREARAEDEGFAAHLHKPIKPSQLFDALVSVLADRPVHVRERGAMRGEFDPEMARRHPLRILLAEDNVVNQKVALRLLGHMGYRADVAANGREAIDAVVRQPYDVVLMDVQMPELDGFEASREINRRWPGEGRPRLVAMTANAMQGDRELCAAAGMDDYVAKPIRVEELVAALGRCSQRPDTVALGNSSPPRAAAASTPSGPLPGVAGVVDGAVIEGLTATMGGVFVAELIDTFGEDARELIATLRRALAEADLDAFRRAAHSLKSTSEALGAAGLAARARELEALARAGSLEGAGNRVERLAETYETVAHRLEALRRDLPA